MKRSELIGAVFLVIGAVFFSAWLLQKTGWGINPIEKDIVYGVKYVITSDGGRYLVRFTEPNDPISFKGRNIKQIRLHPRVLRADSVGDANDPRTIKLAYEMGKAPHGI
ncbi:hypothetical protein D4R51_00385 [bacterium]|nr:MAG: hypothetical protein D4R51_00385 [bacterium]